MGGPASWFTWGCSLAVGGVSSMACTQICEIVKPTNLEEAVKKSKLAKLAHELAMRIAPMCLSEEEEKNHFLDDLDTLKDGTKCGKCVKEKDRWFIESCHKCKNKSSIWASHMNVRACGKPKQLKYGERCNMLDTCLNCETKTKSVCPSTVNGGPPTNSPAESRNLRGKMGRHAGSARRVRLASTTQPGGGAIGSSNVVRSLFGRTAHVAQLVPRARCARTRGRTGTENYSLPAVKSPVGVRIPSAGERRAGSAAMDPSRDGIGSVLGTANRYRPNTLAIFFKDYSKICFRYKRDSLCNV